MKFQSYLETIAGIEIYPMISLVIFVVFFCLLTIRVVRMNKEEVSVLENLPLTDGTNPSGTDQSQS